MNEERILDEVLGYCAQLGISQEEFQEINKNNNVLLNIFKIGMQIGMQSMYQQMSMLPKSPNTEKPKVDDTPRKNVTIEEREDGSRVKITDCGGGWKVYQVL